MTTDSHPPPARISQFFSPILTFAALTLGGLSSYHAVRAEVVELRSSVHTLMQLQGERDRVSEADRREVRDLKQLILSGRAEP